MKKIKLVLSDLHLGNGRYLPDGTINPLEDFVNDTRFIEFVEHYGEHAGDDTDVELIFNGDFFNHIQLMPEEQADGILTERASVNKTVAIIRGHQRMFDALKAFNSRPRRRVVFILGNHDPGLLWKGAQEVIRSVIQGEVVFVPEAYRFDGVHIEHGNRLEPIFRFDNKRYFLTKGYPEPILNLPWGVFFVKDFIFRIDYDRKWHKWLTYIALQMARDQGMKLWNGEGYGDVLEIEGLPHVQQIGDYVKLTKDMMPVDQMARLERQIRRRKDQYDEKKVLLMEQAESKW